MAIKPLIDEVTGFLKDEGYQVIDTLIRDYDNNVALVVEKDGEKSVLPLIERFYDMDSESNITEGYSVIDIRTTPWYKKRKAEAVV